MLEIESCSMKYSLQQPMFSASGPLSKLIFRSPASSGEEGGCLEEFEGSRTAVYVRSPTSRDRSRSCGILSATLDCAWYEDSNEDHRDCKKETVAERFAEVLRERKLLNVKAPLGTGLPRQQPGSVFTHLRRAIKS